MIQAGRRAGIHPLPEQGLGMTDRHYQGVGGGGFTDQYLGIGRIGEPNINIPAEGLNPEPD